MCGYYNFRLPMCEGMANLPRDKGYVYICIEAKRNAVHGRAPPSAPPHSLHGI